MIVFDWIARYASGDDTAYNFCGHDLRGYSWRVLLLCLYIWCRGCFLIWVFCTCSLDTVGGWVLKKEWAKLVICSELWRSTHFCCFEETQANHTHDKYALATPYTGSTIGETALRQTQLDFLKLHGWTLAKSPSLHYHTDIPYDFGLG